jgi:H+/Na+-translocating ferredoxin:NAD+ oxidoreductase subunit B
MSHELANDIDKVLPQTQCGECGYPGCRPYAIALARGEASIDLCPPGGLSTLRALAKLTRQSADPYVKEVERNTRPAALARIRELECIGCTKCIQACPVDAIIGTAKQMHTVIEQECTGCQLCIEPCPVDCIDLIELPQVQFAPDKAKQRFEQRQLRLDRQQQQRWQQHQQALQSQTNGSERRENHQAYIQQAIARVKAKRNAQGDADE